MLDIHIMPLGLLGTNCYILRQQGNDRCLVIDPGAEAKKILSYMEGEDLTVEAILLTHGHFDHVGAVRELAMETDCPVYLNTADLAMPPRMTDGPLYYTNPYGEGTHLDLAGISLDVISTPGHTPGSVCILTEDCMFSGDTLFAGSCGRTDFPCGSMADMEKSMARLRGIQCEYRVFPGHGESTTLSAEKQYNPFM